MLAIALIYKYMEQPGTKWTSYNQKSARISAANVAIGFWP